MDKFERIGCNYQTVASTPEQAIKSFNISCKICCEKMRACFKDCDHCPIEQTHNMVMADFNDAIARNNKTIDK